MTKHKHAEVIKAWADGSDIQFRFHDTGRWEAAEGTPSWNDKNQYRVLIAKDMQDMAVKMMAAFCPDGSLKLCPAESEIKFQAAEVTP